MSLHPDHSTFNDAVPITIPTTSNVVPLRPEPQQMPADTKRTRKAPKPKARKYVWADKVREDENLSANSKVVAWYLSGLFDADEEAAFPTHATIAKRTGMKPKTVQRAIRELEEHCYLRREMGTGILGGNKYRPTWAKLSEASARGDKSDPLGGQIGPLGGDTSDPRGVTDLTPIIQAEYQWENKPETEHLQDEGCATASPPAPARGLDSGKKPSGWDAPDWDDEYRQFASRFPGNRMGDLYQGAFAGIRRRGFSLDDVLVALEHDIKAGNPEGAPRCMASFFAVYFGEDTTKEDVGHWRGALASMRPKIRPAEPRRSGGPSRAAAKLVAASALCGTAGEPADGEGRQERGTTSVAFGEPPPGMEFADEL